MDPATLLTATGSLSSFFGGPGGAPATPNVAKTGDAMFGGLTINGFPGAGSGLSPWLAVGAGLLLGALVAKR